jgi:hypothetical protein
VYAPFFPFANLPLGDDCIRGEYDLFEINLLMPFFVDIVLRQTKFNF